MLVIRFLRVGKRNQSSFKVVVTDKRNPARAGRFVEQVGFYNPRTKEKILKKERFLYWISKGAKPSPTVYNLLIKEGIVEGKKIAVHKKSKKPVEVVAPAPPAAPVKEAAVPAAAPAPAEATASKPAAAAGVPVAEAPKEKKEEPALEGPVA